MYISSCQFVVTASRDYSLHLTNPDILVDWKSIEQIVSFFITNQQFYCRIKFLARDSYILIYASKLNLI